MAKAFGYAMSSAGDVDGDGFDDIVLTGRGGGNHDVHVFYGGPNPSPIANPQTLLTERGRPIDITLTGSDPYGDSVVFSVSSPPSHGSLSHLNGITGEVAYSPEADFSGVDSFEFSLLDPYGQTDSATVQITVDNEAPTFVEPTPSGTLQVAAEGELAFTVAADDAEGDRIIYGVEPLPDHASIDHFAGLFVWRPRLTQIGSHTLTLTANDGHEESARTIEVEVSRPQSGEDAGLADVGQDAGPQDAGWDTGADTRTDGGLDAGDDAGPADAGGDAGPADASPDGSKGRDTGGGMTEDGCGCASSSGPSSGVMAMIVWLAVVGLRRQRRG